MKTYFSFFFISLIAALIVTPWTRNLGIRFGVLDRPNLRKIHQGEIPRLGGVAIVTATVLPFIGFLFYGNLLWEQIRLFWQPLSGLALGSLLVFSVGLLDDRYRVVALAQIGRRNPGRPGGGRLRSPHRISHPAFRLDRWT